MDRPTFLLFHDVVYGGEDGFLPAPVVFTTFLPILVYDFYLSTTIAFGSMFGVDLSGYVYIPALASCFIWSGGHIHIRPHPALDVPPGRGLRLLIGTHLHYPQRAFSFAGPPTRAAFPPAHACPHEITPSGLAVPDGPGLSHWKPWPVSTPGGSGDNNDAYPPERS